MGKVADYHFVLENATAEDLLRADASSPSFCAELLRLSRAASAPRCCDGVELLILQFA